jgi:hypothetical protein
VAGAEQQHLADAVGRRVADQVVDEPGAGDGGGPRTAGPALVDVALEPAADGRGAGEAGELVTVGRCADP